MHHSPTGSPYHSVNHVQSLGFCKKISQQISQLCIPFNQALEAVVCGMRGGGAPNVYHLKWDD